MNDQDLQKKLGFRSIGHKLTAMIGVTIAAGFISILFFYTQQQERNILLQNERTVRNLTQSVNEGLQSVMITGSADVAELYAERLKGVKDVIDFRILRLDGTEAFHDNDTINWINEYRGEVDFDPRPTELPKRVVLKPDDPNLRQAISSQFLVHYYNTDQAGHNALTFLLPIKSEKRCYRCHGKEKNVIGVLEFTTSLQSVQEVVHRTRILSIAVLVVVLLLVLVVTRYVLRKAIIVPLDRVSKAMKLVAEGNLDQLVPVTGRDELGRMAKSFNRMTAELQQTYQGFQTERNKLETIIMGSNEGMVVTNSLGEIVLVNQAAEVLLGKSAATITEAGIYALFDDPDRIRQRLEQATRDSGPDIILYNERFLAVYAASTEDAHGKLSGHAVLIRDMTEEKRLENMLKRLSNADALTGLFNRRYLDESLEAEFHRARSGQRELSVLMFDIDHFKKFNDNYGHDQGDRVLKAFAATTLECVRNLDIACRYGGEEFMVIATETSQAGAMILAERIRQAVETMTVDGLHVTTSIGVAGLTETGAQSPSELIDLADSALYRAKDAGRNRTMQAEVIE
ncbi:MAG TPA: diguanylate cyclase [Rhodocyclaceae bacterium]|nr:diguanylate cyclase [Rhodocyclaceae bacterium]